MRRQGRWEYVNAIYPRDQPASRAEKQRRLDEVCRVTGYHRKSALRLLNGPRPARRPPVPRRRPPPDGLRVIQGLAALWRAAGSPGSVRLNALLPRWLPWARPRFRLSPAVAAQLLRRSPRQMDRRLAAYRRPSQPGRPGARSRGRSGSITFRCDPIGGTSPSPASPSSTGWPSGATRATGSSRTP